MRGRTLRMAAHRCCCTLSAHTSTTATAYGASGCAPLSLDSATRPHGAMSTQMLQVVRGVQSATAHSQLHQSFCDDSLMFQCCHNTCCAPQDVVFYQLPIHAGFYAELINAIGGSTVAAHATVATLFAPEDAGMAAAECWSCMLQHSLQHSVLQMEGCLQHGCNGSTDGPFLRCRGT